MGRGGGIIVSSIFHQGVKTRYRPPVPVKMLAGGAS